MDDGRHITTGKYPFHGGEVHEPEWGPWCMEGEGWMRECQFGDACDQLDYSKEKPQ